MAHNEDASIHELPETIMGLSDPSPRLRARVLPSHDTSESRLVLLAASAGGPSPARR
jgi:hypothetical protein